MSAAGNPKHHRTDLRIIRKYPSATLKRWEKSGKIGQEGWGTFLGDRWTRWQKQAVERTLPVSLCRPWFSNIHSKGERRGNRLAANMTVREP
jgi:hypothetical protein